MAAPVVAAAALTCDVKTKFVLNGGITSKNVPLKRYSNVTLLHLRSENKLTVIDESTIRLLKSLGLLCTEIHTVTGRPVSTGRRLRRRHSRRVRKQKRGNRGGARAKLKANPYRAPLPSILLANVRSLENKLDYLRLELTTRKEIGECCVLIFTETWLNADVPDSAIDMEGLTTFRADRSSVLSGKTRGGRVCMYVNNHWCSNPTTVFSHCSPDIEFLVIKCRPFYLPREINMIFIIAVYIPPSADTKEALNTLYNSISELNSIHPDGVTIVAGDFNQANMRKVLPNYHQHVDFATRGTNTLDHVYTSIKGAFKALPRPHLGSSDHSSVLLIPTYKPVLTRSKPVVRQVKVWPAGGAEALQDCFESTD